MMRTCRCTFPRMLAAAALSSACAFTSLLAAQQPYRVLDRWKIGGEGGWDYLLADSTAHRLYVTHSARVEVLDTANGKVVGAIAGLHGTHGIALDPDGKVGYISDGGGNSVVVFDRQTLAAIATIPVGQNPDGIVYEPTTQTVWAFNGRGSSVSVVDAAQRKVVATISLPGKPEFAVVDGKGTVFVNIEDKNKIVRLDAQTKKATAEWPLTDCDEPSGLGFDIAGGRLFSVCDKHMAVTDSATGKPLANVAIGDGPDATAWDAAHKLVFSSNGQTGTLTVVDAGAHGYSVLETLPTQSGARTMAYDAVTDRIYLSVAESGPRTAPTSENSHPRPNTVADSFSVLVVGR